MSNKYWAVFDKDGEVQALDMDPMCCWDKFKDDSRWRLRELALDTFISDMKAEGYTCKQVVVLPVEEYEKLNDLASLVSGAKAGKPIEC